MIELHKPFYFIRHGETDWNRRRIYMGSTDIPLNQRGLEQATEAAQWLAGEPIAHIATSPSSRASQTAAIIASVLKKTITVIDELKECNWGNKEGTPVVNDMFQQWLQGETPEGAETAHDFGLRVQRGLKSALELPGPVLIVSHGGVYCAIQRIFGWTNTHLANCVPLYHKPSVINKAPPSLPWSICEVSGA